MAALSLLGGAILASCDISTLSVQPFQKSCTQPAGNPKQGKKGKKKDKRERQASKDGNGSTHQAQDSKVTRELSHKLQRVATMAGARMVYALALSRRQETLPCLHNQSLSETRKHDLYKLDQYRPVLSAIVGGLIPSARLGSSRWRLVFFCSPAALK